MRHIASHFLAHPRLLVSAAVGIAAALILPGSHSVTTRSLLGWNVAVWLYLLLLGWKMLHADHERIRSVAMAQAESAATVLTVVVLAAIASLMGIVVELSAAKAPGTPHALPHVAFALATVVGSWLLVPTMFAMSYASLYFRPSPGRALQFPHVDDSFDPDFRDFLYVSFTIAVASQTSDVSITTQPMRRLVLLHSVLSFGFNTAILALSINMAASLL